MIFLSKQIIQFVDRSIYVIFQQVDCLLLDYIHLYSKFCFFYFRHQTMIFFKDVYLVLNPLIQYRSLLLI